MSKEQRRRLIPWGAGALVAVVIALVALGQYAAHGGRSIASEAVAITATTPGATSSYGAYLETQKATGVAQTLTTTAALTNATFDAAALAHLRASAAYKGDASLHTLTASALGQTLTAQHQGTILTLNAGWTTQTGAQAIVTSAVAALGQVATQQALPGVSAQTAADGTVYGAIAQPDTLTVAPDQNAASAAEQTLLTRLGLGAAFGLLLGFALAWLLRRRSVDPATDAVTDPATDPTIAGSAQSQSVAPGDARPAR